MITLASLTNYHKSSVMQRARAWRLKHREEVLVKIKNCNCLIPCEPTGSCIFDPEKWNGENWIWFLHENMRHH